MKRQGIDSLSGSSIPNGTAVAAKRPKPAGNSNIDDEAATQTEEQAWSETLHRQFVEAIYDIGVKNASPSVILENMVSDDDEVTSERVKSHLQKYRNNKEKSRLEFQSEYDSWMQKALTVGAAGGARNMLASPTSIANMMGSAQLLGGELAAFLSYSALYEEMCDHGGEEGSGDLASSVMQNGTREFAKYVTGAKIPFPILTEAERKSPLGVSISHVVSLFYSMTQYIVRARQEKEGAEEADTEQDAKLGAISTPGDAARQLLRVGGVRDAPPAGTSVATRQPNDPSSDVALTGMRHAVAAQPVDATGAHLPLVQQHPSQRQPLSIPIQSFISENGGNSGQKGVMDGYSTQYSSTEAERFVPSANRGSFAAGLPQQHSQIPPSNGIYDKPPGAR